MQRRLAITGLIGSALFTVTRSQAAPPDAAAQALRQNEDQWNKDYESKDIGKLLAHYTDDAVLMAPGMPASHGKEAIGKVLKEMIQDPKLSLKFHATRVEVSKGGDLGFTEGSYTMTMTSPATKKPMTDRGSYVTVYKKQADGSWKAISDIATSEVPPAPPSK